MNPRWPLHCRCTLSTCIAVGGGTHAGREEEEKKEKREGRVKMEGKKRQRGVQRKDGDMVSRV